MSRQTDRKQSLLLAVILILLLLLAAVFVLMKIFVVHNVVIEGADSLPQQEIIRISGIQFGKSMGNVDEEAIRMNIEQGGRFALDEVMKSYPDTVVLRVRERTRDAVVIHAGRYLVMDADGCVIEVLTTMPEDSGVYVYGLDMTTFRLGMPVDAPREKLSAMKSVLQTARELGAIDLISELNLESLTGMTLMTRTGITVRLGDVDRMEEKMMWMKSAIEDLENRGEKWGTLDVSSGSKADYHP